MGELYQLQAISPVTSRVHQTNSAVTGFMGYSTYWRPRKTLDMYLLVTSTLWHSWYLWCNSFVLVLNSQIATFWGDVKLIMQSQCTSHPTPLKKPWICPWVSLDHSLSECFSWIVFLWMLFYSGCKRKWAINMGDWCSMRSRYDVDMENTPFRP